MTAPTNAFGRTQEYSSLWDSYYATDESYSSAVDDQHYFLLYDRYQYPGPFAVDYYFNCSGVNLDITEQLNTCWGGNVRYYSIGSLEFFLAAMYGEDEEGNERMPFFCYQKSGETFTAFDPVYIAEYNGEIPGVIDSSGNPVYSKTKFRLIREDKIIREEY